MHNPQRTFCTSHHLIGVACGIVLFFAAGCKKEGVRKIVDPPPANTPPLVNAGTDTTLTIPQTAVVLAATASDDGGIVEYNWKKISGPSSGYLERYGFKANAVWLEEGVYEFEFSATDHMGASGKDTVMVTVSTQLHKYIVKNVPPSVSMYNEFQLPEEVSKNIKWVFCKSYDRNELADSGAQPNIDYAWGGWYFNTLPDNRIAVYGGSDQPFDLIIYY